MQNCKCSSQSNIIVGVVIFKKKKTKKVYVVREIPILEFLLSSNAKLV